MTLLERLGLLPNVAGRRKALETAATAVLFELRQTGACRKVTRENLAEALGYVRRDSEAERQKA